MPIPIDSSTPVQNPRTRQLLEESNNSLNISNSFTGATPLRRRKAAGGNVSNNQVLLPLADDDAERQERTKQLSFRRSIANLPSSGKTDSLVVSFNDSLNKGPTYNEEEVKVQIQICNKLFTENKITVKNAWQLQVIDLLKHLVGKDKNTGKNDDILQTASQCLEVAGKVYGLRVDSLHADALRLAAQLARTFKQNAKDHKDDGDTSDGAIDGEGQKKVREKRKKKRVVGLSRSTVVNHDPAAWSAPLPKVESAIFSAKNDVTMSTNANLLTNQLRMDHSACKFMLLSKEKAWVTYAKDTVVAEPQPKFPVALPKFDHFNLCPPFKDFVLDEWDLEDEKKALELKSLSQQNVLGDVVLNENGVPIHELDGSLRDVFAEPNNFDDLDGLDEPRYEEETVAHFREEVDFITDFMAQASSVTDFERSEYSHNTLIQTAHGKIDQIWAGPSHWKLKYIRRSNTTYSGRDVQKQHKARKRKIQEDEPIDAWARVNEPVPDRDSLPKFVPKRKVKYQDSKKLVIPLLDFRCQQIMANIDYLMCLPLTKPVRKDQNANNVECDIPSYNYENAMDKEYCPNDDHNDDGPDLADDLFDNDGHTIVEEHIAHHAHLGDNLIDAPETVAHSYVPFALRAKRMDMRKLKLAIWKFLTKSDKEEVDSELPIMRTTFSELYNNLPNLLPETMKQELSCGLSFSALLHLANDLYLVMPKRENDITDFDIYK